MKELRHDSESYIITIRRKGQQTTAAQTVTPSAIPRMKPSAHEYGASGLHEPQASYSAATGDTATKVTAPLPGIIVALKGNAGDTVREGQELAVLEAMKMENSILAHKSGTIRDIRVSTGESVSEGTVIMTLD